MQISLGLPEPSEQSSLPILKRVQAGIRRAHAAKGNHQKVRLPITATVLRQIKAVLDTSSSPDKAVLWSIASTAFFGFFRLGELLLSSPKGFKPTLDLAWGDVAINDRTNPTMVQIHLKRSKVDQFGTGANIVLGRTGEDLCPVSAILNYIAVRGTEPGPFFVDGKRRPIVKSHFVEEIRSILSAAGLRAQDYSGHSFRIGAATSAAQAGIEDSMIKTLGRWHSVAFLQYIRTPGEELAAVTSRLVSPIPPAHPPSGPPQ